MMKKLAAVAVFAFIISALSAQDSNGIDWRYGRPGVFVVTNAPTRAEHVSLSNHLEQAMTSYLPATRPG